MNNKMMMLGFWTMSIVFACQGAALSSKETLQALKLQRRLVTDSKASPESKFMVLMQLQETAQNVQVSGVKEKQILHTLEHRLKKDLAALVTPRQKPGKKLVFVD